MRSLRSLAGLALVAAAFAPAHAQSGIEIGARIAPQFYSYEIKTPITTKVTEFAAPVFVVVPVTPRFAFDIGTSFTNAKVTSGDAESTISGLTDTQLRASYTFGNDFVVLTAGVNLPTGRSKVEDDEITAASVIGSDFFAFPISNMGTGFGATGGIAIAHPVGANWNLGIGASMRHAAEYEPYEPGLTGGTSLHYTPGDEYRVRAGIDRNLGTGRMTFGVTYSTFGTDDFAGSIYNTGDRFITQFSLSSAVGGGNLSFSAWDLLRQSGGLADGSTTGQENIIDGTLAYAVRLSPSAVLEPNVEGRIWSRKADAGATIPSSNIGTVGLRLQLGAGAFSVVPSAGYSFGKFAAGGPETVDMSGYQATLAIRVR